MSQPSLPNITPNISLTRDDAVNLVLSSIAMEEMGMSHILNAEGEKLQYVLGTIPGLTGPSATISDLLAVNSSVKDMVNAITKNEYVLQQKLEAVTNIPLSVGPMGSTGPTGDFNIDTDLFYVDGPGDTIAMALGDTLTFQSDSLNINVNQTSSTVSIEAPQGPTVSSIIPYQATRVYFDNYSSYGQNIYLNNTFFPYPLDGVITKITLSLKINSFFLAPNVTGTISYSILTKPLDSDIITTVASAPLSPLLNESTPIDSYVTAIDNFSIPITASTRIAIQLQYVTNDRSVSDNLIDYFGSLLILPS